METGTTVSVRTGMTLYGEVVEVIDNTVKIRWFDPWTEEETHLFVPLENVTIYD